MKMIKSTKFFLVLLLLLLLSSINVLSGFTKAYLSSCNRQTNCSSSIDEKRLEPCCFLSPYLSPKNVLIRSLSPRYFSPLMPSPVLNPPSLELNETNNEEYEGHLTNSNPTASSMPQLPSLPVWTNWYFWLFVALLLMISLASCGYWRKRKIYESSASQTLTHVRGLFPTPTPSDNTPLYGPPLPFLPPAAYPAPPPYSEAARPSYDRLDHRHLFDALLSGRTVYDFYDRRHPNEYYDRYFLPDDTSSSETASLLSYRLQRSCSAHLPKHHAVMMCHDMPPPYSEVTAKPEMYPPVVVVKGPNKGGGVRSASIATEMKTTKSMIEPHHHHHHGPHWLPSHYYTYRSGSISTPDGSQSSSIPGYGYHHAIDLSRSRKGTVSPATLLASCSGIPSPASSSGPLPSDVSSLAPTSPPSPPAPTSPTLQLTNEASQASKKEFRDVLHKISQLPRASSPISPLGLSSDCHSPGGMLSPVTLTPGISPGSSRTPRSCSRGSQTMWENPFSLTPLPPMQKPKRKLVNSFSMEGSEAPIRPKSLFLGDNENRNPSLSTSTPNLYIPQNRCNRGSTNLSSPLQNLTPLNNAPANSTITLEASLNRSRVEHRTFGRNHDKKRWWESYNPIHHV